MQILLGLTDELIHICGFPAAADYAEAVATSVPRWPVLLGALLAPG
mgnify:CR=1 FL=1